MWVDVALALDPHPDVEVVAVVVMLVMDVANHANGDDDFVADDRSDAIFDLFDGNRLFLCHLGDVNV